MTPIKVFWHVNELNGWNNVMDQQWDLIEKSGLWDAADEINICMNGQPWTFSGWLSTKNITDTNGKIKMVNVNTSAAFHEFPTLRYMHEVSKAATEPFYICYIHLKGLLRWGDENVGDWRNFMNYYAIEQWKENVAKLEEGYDTVGTNYNTEPWPHFAGNFWWANSAYVASLDHLHHPEDRMNRAYTQFAPHPTQSHWRFDHEAWVNSKNPKYFELARSLEPGERHYRERYSAENYRGS